MRELLTYFAYGSNMHPVRLWQRVQSCVAIDLAEVTGYSLRFHKRSLDGSGKCNLFHTGQGADRVHGVVYQIEAHEKPLLDEAEGVGRGYNVGHVRVAGMDEVYTAFTYIADPDFIDDSLTPYTWYKALVITGARMHRVPEHYIMHIDRHEAIEDSNTLRQKEHLDILEHPHADLLSK
jgi:hypothetical protein